MGAPGDDRRRRAEQRSSWPIQKRTLASQASDDLSDETTALERLSMMWELALTGWLLSGRSLPAYERRLAPGRLIRPRR